MEGILDAISAAPDDDGPRFVLADLLLGRGDSYGELISLQVRHAALGLGFEPSGAARLRELWAKHAAELPVRYFDDRVLQRVMFHRGLPAIVRARAEDWLQRPDPRVPLTVLELSDVLPSHLAALLQRKSTRQLRGLRLRAIEGERWSLDEAQLLGAADLPRLAHLGLFLAWRNPVAAQTFCSSSVVRKLKSIELGNSLSSDPVRVLQALAATANELEEISLDDDLPVSIARSVAHCRIVSFPDSFVRPQLSEALSPRTALYLPPHVTTPTTKGGPRVGRWHSVTPLGVRNGLDASYAQEETTGLGGLLLRMRSMTADFDSPKSWLEPRHALVDPGDCALGPIDGGICDSGEWAVFALGSGERLDRVVELEGKLPLSPVAHAAAWSRVARWVAARRDVKPPPLSSVFAGPRGLQVQPLCAELHSRRRGPARYTRREFVELSPEAARDQPLDELNATWVLAMQVCLTFGVRVFGETVRTDHELLRQILQGPPIELYGHGLPPKLRDILKASLNRDRSMRPTPRALADTLSVFDGPATRAELALLPDSTDELERAREQAEGWLEGSSIHEREART